MAFLENLENQIFQDELPFEVNPKVEKIIQEMINDPDHQALMKKLANMDENNWDNEGGMVTEQHLKDYEERLKYMEENGI